MRKGYVCALGMFIVLTIAGCGGASKSVDVTYKSSQTQTPTPTPTPTVAPSQSPEQVKPSASPIETIAPTATPVGKDEGKGVIYRINKESDSDWDEDKQLLFSSSTYHTIQVDSKEFPALATQIEKWNAKNKKESKELAKESRNDNGNLLDAFQPYEIKADCLVKRADSKVFSFVNSTYYYKGGVHGEIIYEAYNYDTMTGKEILLPDVITNNQALADALEEKLVGVYGDEMFGDEDVSQTIMKKYFTDSKEKDYELKYTLGYKSITFYFSNYEFVCYAAGTQEVTLTSAEYPELFQSEYCTYVPATYAYSISILQDNSIDIAGDGTPDTIYISGKMDSDNDAYEKVSIKVNGKATTKKIHSYDLVPYYVFANGKSYVYIQLCAENGNQSYMVYDVTSGKPKYVDTGYGELLGLSTPSYFYIEEQLEMLSTYVGTRVFHIGDNGMPVSETTEYEAQPAYPIISTVVLKGEVLDVSTGKVTGEESFPKGTTFTIIATDNKTYVKMKADDGRIAKFNVTPEWPQKINGKKAENCFKELYYAG